jgi:hypothetical protein
VADNEVGISREVGAANRNLINQKNRDKARDHAEDEVRAQENLLKSMEALKREHFDQDLHQAETQEEALLKQIEEMNKEIVSATEMALAIEEEDELDQVWHLGRAYYPPPSGATSLLKDYVTPSTPADATFDELESKDEDGGHLEDSAMTAVLRFPDDEVCLTGKAAVDESVTSKTSAESSRSNQVESGRKRES